MAADWTTFISDVSDKLASQSIGSYEEMADFLRNEYISATVGKAASPYGEMHVQGNDAVLFDGFKSGFKILYEGGDLTFEEKKTSPEYADLDVQPPTVDISGAADQVDLDFRDWAEENKSTIPPFVYSQFFSQYPNFPKDRSQAVIEIARKILHQFDGTGSYLQWMYSLRTGAYSDWGNLIMDQVIKLLKIETDRPLQPGDDVRGFAKYRSRTEELTYLTLEAFNNMKGDINVDNTDSYSDTYREIVNSSGGNYKKYDLVDGKITSVINKKGSEEITVSYFSKQYNKTFIRQLIPGTVNRKISINDISNNLPSVDITRQLLQDQHLSNPGKIPDYLTANFITHFTYSKYDSGYLRALLKEQNYADTAIDRAELEFNDNYQYSNEIIDLFSKNQSQSIFSSFYSNVFTNTFGGANAFTFQWIKQQHDWNKANEYSSEETRYRELKIRWINEVADKARKNEDPDKPEDAYNVMAKGVLDYWKSCGPQPLTNEPGAPPCTFSPPQGGVYVPIYYGSQTMLGNNVRRAFNTGKRFTQPGEKMVAAKMVASALAYSFAMHLLELKFIYQGGIPGPDGPLPMIGFIPLVY
jgi:hypothetical protein